MYAFFMTNAPNSNLVENQNFACKNGKRRGSVLKIINKVVKSGKKW
jgi:hypothetical protein